MDSSVITDQRLARFESVAAARQPMTVILENVHDPHNIGAVMRTCDSVGIKEIYILYTEDHLTPSRLDKVQGSSTGVRKWIHVHFYRDVDDCFDAVRKKYDSIYATHLGTESVDLYQLDLSQNVALLFGNEHEGLSQQALAHADGNFIIPQFGLVQSLNISVACAVTLYEALRQRKSKGLYEGGLEDSEENQAYYEFLVDKHKSRYQR